MRQEELADGRLQAGLNWTEARRRAGSVEVTGYDVELDITGLAAGDLYRSSSTLSFRSQTADDPLWLDLIADRIHSIRHNGQPLDPPSDPAQERLWFLPLSGSNVIEVIATHRSASSRSGLNRTVDSDGSVYLWSQMQPFDARRVFACFDQPDLKAPLRLRAIAPAGWTCVSNGDVTGREQVGGGAERWSFAETPPLPTYAMALCSGPFAAVSARHGELPLRLYARRSLSQHLESQAEDLFRLMRQGLDVFGQAFGLTYPGASYDTVFVPGMVGAMENFGCVTCSDVAIFRSSASRAQVEHRALVLLHEMAHMWFGNLVTMRWWDDLWLNESFADWAAFWAAARATEHVDAWASFTAARKRPGYLADDAPTTHPISRPVADVDGAEASFDAITYAKGAAVLRQLVSYTGEPQFLAGLRRYFSRYAWTNSDIDGLLDELAASSGRDVHGGAAAWRRTSGTNTLEISPHIGPDGTYAEVIIHQRAPSEHPRLRPHRTTLGCYRFDAAGRLQLGKRLKIDIDGASTRVDALEGVPAADLLLLNDLDDAFARVRLDPGSLETLLQAGQTLPETMARAVGCQVVWDLVRCAELPAERLIGFALSGITSEPSLPNLTALIATATEALRLYTPLDRLPPLAAELARACGAAADRLPVGDERWATFQEGFLAWAGRSEATRLEAALAEGSGWPQQLRWQALARLYALELGEPALLVHEQARDQDPDVAIHAAAAEAARPDRVAKSRALDRIFDDPEVRPQHLQVLAAGLWQPTQHTLLKPVANSFLDRLPEVDHAMGWPRVRSVVSWAFPTAGFDEAFVRQAGRLAADRRWHPAVADALANGVHRLQEAHKARRMHGL